MEVNGDHNGFINHIFQNILFYVQQKKEIHTGLK